MTRPVGVQRLIILCKATVNICPKLSSDAAHIFSSCGRVYHYTLEFSSYDASLEFVA